MDLDIRMARERFKEFLPEGRGLEMIKDLDIMTVTEHLMVSYKIPKVPSFNEKLDTVLIRFGWKLLEERLDISPERIYITFERDQLTPPQEQGKKLIAEREAKKEKTAGLREINI